MASEFGLNDDWITDLLLDKIGFSPFVRKFTGDYSSLTIPEEDIASALEAVTKQANHLESTCRLLEILHQHGYLEQLSKPIHFKDQLASYVQMYLPDCPFEINITCQYSAMPEACVTARKPISRGIVKYLCGFLVSLKEEEEHDLDVTGRNFTVVTSSRNKFLLLFLGLGRFVNHDCEGNAEL
ncbi:hypothetical protein K469DRAFT_689641 [Zopfia rhizophila CBS 207.26]|uniref:SET domain-containing protein n=1 Tax=Zopfia rhizophila CBS 207.26 TaxID=1314779 RepID=A0A6A6DXX7_9PEZI|nr:hypothetical protein K469DRAFT_689641 [Zopfia rhizophila CBS 207.26]